MHHLQNFFAFEAAFWVVQLNTSQEKRAVGQIKTKEQIILKVRIEKKADRAQDQHQEEVTMQKEAPEAIQIVSNLDI